MNARSLPLLPPHRLPLWALAAALLAIVLLYSTTFAGLLGTWIADATYQHSFLIPPVCAWMIWRRRAALAAATISPSLAGVGILIVLGAVFVLAKATGVRVVEQFAVVGMIPASVLAIAGAPVVRLLAFPLAFLFLMVPVGQVLVPWLMHVTTEITVWAVQMSGIPVYRSGFYFSIPAGDFEVAKACSGVRYLIASGTYGVLFAYLMMRTWRMRIAFVAVSLLVPILANGIRAYLIVIIAHLSQMRYATGFDHLVYGFVFFAVVLALLSWIGIVMTRHERAPVKTEKTDPRTETGARIKLPFAVVAGAALIAMVVPAWYAMAAESNLRNVASVTAAMRLPVATASWSGPDLPFEIWRPDYHNALSEVSGLYTGPSGERVSLFMALYPAHAAAGSEMIHFENRLQEGGEEARDSVSRHVAQTGSGASFEVGEAVVREKRSGRERLAWRWYEVGERAASTAVHVKMLEGLAYLRGENAPQRVYVVSTPLDGDLALARSALQSFLSGHHASLASCVHSDSAASCVERTGSP